MRAAARFNHDIRPPPAGHAADGRTVSESSAISRVRAHLLGRFQTVRDSVNDADPRRARSRREGAGAQADRTGALHDYPVAELDLR